MTIQEIKLRDIPEFTKTMIGGQLHRSQSKVTRYCQEHPIQPRSRHREKQDLSGHVCFDNELYEFYRTSELRANRIERARLNGTLNIQPSRNPLRAEKTPRRDYTGFSLKPTALPLNPQQNNGMINDDKSIQIQQTSTQNNDRIPLGSSAAQEVSEGHDDSEQTKSQVNTKSKEEIVGSALSAPRWHDQAEKKGTIDVAKIEKDLLKTSLSEFRRKVGKDPLLLARWRAEKAAEYISEHGVAVPKPRDNGRKPFASSGFSSSNRLSEKHSAKNHAGVKLQTTPLKSITIKDDKDDALKNINQLRQKLVDTEREIERQELKLALLNNTKHYELPIGKSRRESSS